MSISAVSFALNGRPGVSEATRERVRQAARELDWQPHTAARALGGREGRVDRLRAEPPGAHARHRVVLRRPHLGDPARPDRHPHRHDPARRP
ncbi:helix-turn-helix domain-containing protein [Curtobacterium sp. MCJR17_043]|nr:helix-turn-helix domain-containing protein [Curtobacterium sp. MCJR17_043]WIB36996.1 helix-turn-helix domain-containing protein [Curtobacterium sp. MCJR17_043]